MLARKKNEECLRYGSERKWQKLRNNGSLNTASQKGHEKAAVRGRGGDCFYG